MSEDPEDPEVREIPEDPEDPEVREIPEDPEVREGGHVCARAGMCARGLECVPEGGDDGRGWWC